MDSTVKAPNGKVYELSPLDLEDLLTVKRHAQFAEWHTLNALKEDFPAEQIDPQLSKVFDSCCKKIVTEKDLDVYINTLEGVREVLYLSIKHKHDNVCREDAGRLLTVQNAGDIRKTILMLSGAWEDAPTGNPPEQKKPST